MTQEDRTEFEKMKKILRDFETGSRFIKWSFFTITAIGGAYLMLKQILNPHP